jgi:hypothetical protein
MINIGIINNKGNKTVKDKKRDLPRSGIENKI